MSDATPYGGLDVDDRRTIRATFKDENGDPATIAIDDLTVIVEPPTGESFQVENADITIADGVVSFKIDFDEGGTWKWRVAWISTLGAETKEGRVRVRSRRTTNPTP